MCSALLLPLLLGQCGPGGCAIGPQWYPITPVVPHVTVNDTLQRAYVTVTVEPPQARVWFDDHEITLRDGKATLQTPPLRPGKYRYRVTARWGDIERQWFVTVTPGKTTSVVLRRETKTAKDGTNAAPHSKPAESSAPKRSDSLPVIEQDGVQNFGLVRSGLGGSGERFSLDGQPISKTEAVRLLQTGLADDSDKLRLTIIGSEADRKRVLDDLKGPLADIAAQCLVQDYPPDHWAVAKAGFYTSGQPTIYVQAPDGTVLHRQDDYADGAEGLRQAFERIRRPDPHYDPRRDPDRRRLGGGALSRLFYILAYPFRVVLSWLAAAFVLYLLVAAVAKGWLVYLLGLLARLVPSPPQAPSEQPTVQHAARRRKSSRSRK